MAEEKLLTVRDVSLLLGISEKEVVDLSESGAIPAYKVAGVYLRFKKEQVEAYRKISRAPLSSSAPAKGYPVKDKISDFFYFNDFYLLSAALIALLLVIIFKG